MVTPNGVKAKTHVSLQVSTSRKGLLTDEISPKEFPDNVTNFSSKLKLQNLRAKGNMPSPSSGSQGIVLFRRIEWSSVMFMCKEWIKKPLNLVLLIWITCVVISGAILFLVMTGMLNHVLPKKSQRDLWFEINNQIINALFTLMCLYQQPKRFHHLALLCRWNPKDIAYLRKIYCKNETHKPKERAHMMVVVILLHLNCFAQYALCALNLGYKRSNRPIIGVSVCLSVAIISPAIAGLYSMLSPLGKDYECDVDEEAPTHLRRKSLELGEELGTLESKPGWRGGLFHLWEDFTGAYLSIFCFFCVFGWNMERLGFGNMYVHIATFLLLCFAPFWIFNLAAVNIDNDAMRAIIGISGIVLCFFGLLYGGFWRIQMRKRFKLPPNNLCFGKPGFADCFQWLFCCWCSLAQEIRTGDFYHIVDNRFRRKQMGDKDDDGHTPLTPLPREGVADFESSVWMDSSLSNMRPSILKDDIMKPPSPSTMRMVS